MKRILVNKLKLIVGILFIIALISNSHASAVSYFYKYKILNFYSNINNVTKKPLLYNLFIVKKISSEESLIVYKNIIRLLPGNYYYIDYNDQTNELLFKINNTILRTPNIQSADIICYIHPKTYIMNIFLPYFNKKTSVSGDSTIEIPVDSSHVYILKPLK
ncbi:hypothetical protein DEFDS_P225 (plasmid) [Deferribacter desulfuricans SSM1]|uniref:Uncharacterized protein n=1 Tax=Deferribacter desulfuricans (strain DSM 14783 / JCM 11476 / NBRC 101012 / SSM1) TaxID=639282 RepID=D3PF53_DEFDS|nr:hypothetical protein [Deferribacter desulfuricans]BAI81845.1 hypothetical protein DEFDS_P225 [Deferribacter desulfuricans SSM1]